MTTIKDILNETSIENYNIHHTAVIIWEDPLCKGEYCQRSAAFNEYMEAISWADYMYNNYKKGSFKPIFSIYVDGVFYRGNNSED